MYMFSNSVCGNFSWQFCFHLFVFCWFPVDKIRRQNCSKHTSWSLSLSLSLIYLRFHWQEQHSKYTLNCSHILLNVLLLRHIDILPSCSLPCIDDVIRLAMIIIINITLAKKSEILGHWPKFHFSFLFIATRWEWNWICMCMYMCVSMFVLQVILIEHIIVYISYSTPIAIIASTNKI